MEQPGAGPASPCPITTVDDTAIEDHARTTWSGDNLAHFGLVFASVGLATCWISSSRLGPSFDSQIRSESDSIQLAILLYSGQSWPDLPWSVWIVVLPRRFSVVHSGCDSQHSRDEVTFHAAVHVREWSKPRERVNARHLADLLSSRRL